MPLPISKSPIIDRFIRLRIGSFLHDIAGKLTATQVMQQFERASDPVEYVISALRRDTVMASLHVRADYIGFALENAIGNLTIGAYAFKCATTDGKELAASQDEVLNSLRATFAAADNVTIEGQMDNDLEEFRLDPEDEASLIHESTV